MLAKKLGEVLLAKGLKIATAESCTGGWVAQAISSVAGSSQWFERGMVTYSNEAKQELLEVPAEILEEYGAVSEKTAEAMAEGALNNSPVDIAIATTGIAGPDGGSKTKPVGMVCFAIAQTNCSTKTFIEQFAGDRESVREQAVEFVLNKLVACFS